MRTTITVDDTTNPMSASLEYQWLDKDRKPKGDPFYEHARFRLDGDRLLFCMSSSNKLHTVSDDIGSLYTLQRDRGPVPEFKQPSGTPPIDDPLLGRLNWDDNSRCYEGRFDRQGQSLCLHVSADPASPAAVDLTRAKHIVTNLNRYVALAKKYAAIFLLDVKNESWLDEDDEEVSQDQFMAQMKLETVAVRHDGSVEFWHDCDDLFWGHGIMVQIRPDDTCSRADIVG